MKERQKFKKWKNPRKKFKTWSKKSNENAKIEKGLRKIEGRGGKCKKKRRKRNLKIEGKERWIQKIDEKNDGREKNSKKVWKNSKNVENAI